MIERLFPRIWRGRCPLSQLRQQVSHIEESMLSLLPLA